MGTNFPPGKDALLLSMAQDFATKVTAAPASYFYTVAQATENASFTAAFVSAYEAALDPATRTKAKVAAKQSAKKLLINNLRMLNRYAQANPLMTDEKKIELGLPVYASRTPINPPTDVPVIELLKLLGRTANIAIRTAGTERRGRPEGVQGAMVLSFTGADAPPTDLTQWKTEGLVTRGNFDLVFPPTIPAGTQVWLTALFYNPRGQSGPACDPVSLHIAGGLSTSEAA